MNNDREARVGVYVCHCGGNISDKVDVQQVAERVARIPGVVVARTHTFMCSDPGQGLIQEDIRREGLTRVVVASCSPRLHEQTFRSAVRRAGLNPYLYEHANIREQVSWVTHERGSATDKATRLVAAAVAKAQRLEPLEPIRVDGRRNAVVVGGGVSGLKAARDLAAYGINVTLVERTPFLGGNVARLDRVYPTEEDALGLLNPLIQEVVESPRVEVLTNAEIVAAEGYVGNFRLKVRQRPRGVSEGFAAMETAAAVCPVELPNEHEYELAPRKAIYRSHDGCYPSTPAIDWQACSRCGRCAEVAGGAIDLNLEPTVLDLEAGSIVVATGFEHYEPDPGEYGYQELPEVVTLPQLIRLLAAARSESGLPLPAGEGRGEGSVGAPAKPVLALTLSQRERELGVSRRELVWHGRPVRNIALIHCVGSRQIEGIHEPRDGQPLNEYCSRVCCTATLQAANELKELFPEVNVFDFYRDIRTYGRDHEQYYEDASRNGTLFFRYAPEEAPLVERSPEGSEHPVVVRVKDRLTWGEEMEVPVDLVVLAVGMVPRKVDDLVSMLKLPVGSDGYLLEVHPKLRPVEVAVNGLLLAGTVQGPKDITESAAAASAAAVKAATILSRGYVELDPFVAAVDSSKCDGCGECIEACGYEGAISLAGREGNAAGAAARTAKVNPALCKGCGSCVAVCPRGAVELKGWTLEQYDAMVDALCDEDLLAAEATT